MIKLLKRVILLYWNIQEILESTYSHRYSRFINQSVSLLEELEKEIKNYSVSWQLITLLICIMKQEIKSYQIKLNFKDKHLCKSKDVYIDESQ